MIDFTGMWLRQHLPEQHDVALVHNDFRNGNLMIDHEKGLVAVLDWETSHIGDPIRDLGWICTNSWRFGRRDLEVGGFGIIDDLIFGYEDESGKAVVAMHSNFGKYSEALVGDWMLGNDDRIATAPMQLLSALLSEGVRQSAKWIASTC